MSYLNPNIMGPGPGLFPSNGSVIVRNVTANAFTAGMVVALDLSQIDADTASIVPGHATAAGACDNVFGCVIATASAALSRFGQFFVVLETIAAGGTGKAAPTGVVVANICANTGATVSNGAPLVVCSYTNATLGSSGLFLQPAFITGLTASTASQIGEKVVAYLLGTTFASVSATNSGSTGTANVWFLGIGAGFGQNAA